MKNLYTKEMLILLYSNLSSIYIPNQNLNLNHELANNG